MNQLTTSSFGVTQKNTRQTDFYWTKANAAPMKCLFVRKTFPMAKLPIMFIDLINLTEMFNLTEWFNHGKIACST